ncbi:MULTISPECIES: hypothetical protein [Methylobacterium]|uniref:Uncharacterized protein n=1 Tax=Methylobacterium longum TaxID=767694 RepID=A0ABT8ANE4_9HYPH|nr:MULTISPECIES: hypothetical protein [Methylobacterium]MCJ2099758.1 hypothetical protein [Methylobacterium sp. E-046]MDN3570929.1 hypothetical protein [Methylobacterium longum]GJE12041.1 hypothetical protein FOHLNKBM_3087 [Methylobacterium longum]
MQPIDTLQTESPAGPLGTLVAANLKSAAVDPFEAFVAPGDVFRHPRAVLAHPGLSRAEKRAVLASWASDARAVESCPTLRCLPGCRAEPVPIDEILAALQALDEGSSQGGAAPAASPRPLDPEAFTRRWQRGPATGRRSLN